MCGVPLDNWSNSGSVDIFTYGEYGFSSMRSWCYST